MNNYLEVRNLSKSFEGFQLHDITFTLPSREVKILGKSRVVVKGYP